MKDYAALNLEGLRNLYADLKEKRLSTGGHKKYDRLLAEEKDVLAEIERREGREEKRAEDAANGEEDYPQYLRRVADDYRESDSDSPTAEDYDESADRIESAIVLLKNLQSDVCANLTDARRTQIASVLNRLESK